MSVQEYVITHYYHSGFSVSCEKTILIFDYWTGEDGELAENLRLTPEKLSRFEEIFVFISHDHIDHMDPVVFTWKDLPGIRYVVSSDMPVGTRGRRMAPGDEIVFSENVKVHAFDSTDPGVSFLVDFRGLQLFHAGDLNFWHWRDESTMKEIEEAEDDFRKALQPITSHPVDIAFFPLDPRQGTMFEAGANFFILSVKPRILIPMHYFHRAEVAVDYARTASCRGTEVIAMPGYGDQLGVEMDEEGYLNLYLPEPVEETEPEVEEENPDGMLAEDDPFLESDLPVAQLAEDPGEEPAETTPEDSAPEV